MFLKPLKVKSSSQLKGSEVKKLRAQIQKEYSTLTDEDFRKLFPPKCGITCSKVTTHSGYVSSVFAVDKRPMFFEIEEGKLAPTIYAMWLLPEILPYFTIGAGVLEKLSNGADLMLPGITKIGTGLGMYGNYKKGQLMAINLTFNTSAVVIGVLLRSSDDLYHSAGRGVAVKPAHLFGDKLWGIEPSMTLQIPTETAVANVNMASNSDFPPLGTESNHKSENISLPNIDDLQIVEETSSPIEVSQDDILRAAFFSACKYKSKSLNLPILTSDFYRNYVLPEAKCAIEIKKTTYKKLSTFLKAMSDENFIEVKEDKPGVDKIHSINFDHEDLKNFIPDQTISGEEVKEKETLFHSSMAELYLVTEETLPFFTQFDYKRNDGMPAANVRKLLREYCRKNRLPFTDESRTLTVLDDCLRNVCDDKHAASLNDMNAIFLGKMKHTYEMIGVNELKQANKQKIEITIGKRSGNKVVTLVRNLERYGIILTEFVKLCKQGAAASTTIVKDKNSKDELLQVQGNQVKIILQLLTEKYKISSKQICAPQIKKVKK